VSSIEAARGKWVLTSTTPDASGNLTAYYIGILDPNRATPLLVDSVRMHPDIEATVLSESTVWDKTNQKWVTTQQRNSTHGYENARYTLTATMYTVQATKEALDEMFTSSGTHEQYIISGMGTDAITGRDVRTTRHDDPVAQKLFFEEVDGYMRYTPVITGDSWFKSHLNMIPGGDYEDTLLIENLSKKSYKLYMQVIPIEQAPLPDALLELIHMQVYQDATMIYDGTALGKDYPSKLGNLHNVVYLGDYLPAKTDNLKVDLLLDKDTPMEYAGILSNIDWKFMVEDMPEEEPKKPPVNPPVLLGAPKTGDQTLFSHYLLVASAALAVTALGVAVKARNEERLG
jgi:hypothetical protein